MNNIGESKKFIYNDLIPYFNREVVKYECIPSNAKLELSVFDDRNKCYLDQIIDCENEASSLAEKVKTGIGELANKVIDYLKKHPFNSDQLSINADVYIKTTKNEYIWIRNYTLLTSTGIAVDRVGFHSLTIDEINHHVKIYRDAYHRNYYPVTDAVGKFQSHKPNFKTKSTSDLLKMGIICSIFMGVYLCGIMDY